MMAIQLYDSISLRDVWWNICCPECGKPMAQNPYRDVRITWSEILGIAIELWGKPDGFFIKDFLTSMEFLKGKIVLTFCSQGPRRGEVEISVPVGDKEATVQKKIFVDRIRAMIEAVSSQDQEFLDDSEEWEYEDEWEDDDEDEDAV